MSVFPRPRSLLIAIVSLVSVVVTARADTPATPVAHQTEPFRQGALIDTFGQWEIRKGLIDHTFLLIGASKGDGEGHFWLHCDQNNLITVAVPLLERPRDRVRSHAVTIHADTGPTRAMSLIVFEDFVAVAIDFDGARNDKVADFLDVLRSAKDTVTISYSDRSFDYDITQLQAAQARFRELCSRPARH
jgi:hypothetical protein